jgi:hypothetical protein
MTKLHRGGTIEWFGILHLQSSGTDSPIGGFPRLPWYCLGRRYPFADEAYDGCQVGFW